jgi:hypothetical protein
MALIDRLRQELDRAGRQASRAIDEGKMRLELYRAKQSVDRFAQRFGYAVFRAKQAGTELPPEELTAHMNNLVAAEAEVKRLETLIEEATKERNEWLRDTRHASTPGPETKAEAKAQAESTSGSSPSSKPDGEG